MSWSLRRLMLAGGLSLMLLVAFLSIGDAARLAAAAEGLLARPELLALFLATYTLAFYLRAIGWRLLLPTGPGARQLFLILQIALLANHLFPAKAGEVVRVALLARRGVPLGTAASSTMLARLIDFGVVCLIALALGPVVGGRLDILLGLLIAPLAAVVLGALVCLSLVVCHRGTDTSTPDDQSHWGQTLALRYGLPRLPRLPARVEKIVQEARAALIGISPGRLLVVFALVIPSWLLEAGALWSMAQAAGIPLSLGAAAGATAFAIAFQGFGITPGGLGVYEASLTGVLVLFGVDPATGLALAVATHALKFAYSYSVGIPCLVFDLFARQWLLSGRPLPPPEPPPAGSVVAIVIPVHNEASTIASVVAGVPRARLEELGFETRVVVVDDGSTDDSGRIASAAGADRVVTHPDRLGLGAALRSGLATAVEIGAGAAIYLDGDGEYDPADIPSVALPILRGEADYVLGSRFPHAARLMRPSRRLGNLLFTALVSLMAGRRLLDGQTGFRAFSRRAMEGAEILHDYNYAQVLTLNLLRKRMRLAQTPISYRTRQHGKSFIRYHEYLRRVLPAMVREVLRP